MPIIKVTLLDGTDLGPLGAWVDGVAELGVVLVNGERRRSNGTVWHCPHGRQRHTCKDCGGAGICPHGRQRYQCKDCGGSGICEHGRRRSRCKECGGGGPVTFLEATEVEEFDGEEDPDEWVPTVQARVVGGPRGGKRKR